MSPLVNRKGLAPAVGEAGAVGEIHLFWEAGGKGSLVNVTLLLTGNVPTLHTVLPGVSEKSGSARNSCSASDGVIPPEEAEGRG